MQSAPCPDICHASSPCSNPYTGLPAGQRGETGLGGLADNWQVGALLHKLLTPNNTLPLRARVQLTCHRSRGVRVGAGLQGGGCIACRVGADTSAWGLQPRRDCLERGGRSPTSKLSALTCGWAHALQSGVILAASCHSTHSPAHPAPVATPAVGHHTVQPTGTCW